VTLPLIELFYSRRNSGIDRVLGAIVGLFDESFPDRIRAYYLVGSQADGSAVESSDLDVRVVFKGSFCGEVELQRFLRIREYLRKISPIEIDCPPLDEQRLQSDENWLHEALSIKHASQFLYGEDIRGQLPDPTIEAYLENVAQALRLFLGRLHRQNPITFPVRYPDPQGEFYGFDAPGSGQESPSLKMLVHVAGFLATWRIGRESGQMVVRKSDWLPKYQTFIRDSWTPLLTELWKRCKVTWSYHLPDDPMDRVWLKQACDQFLLFENDTLNRYTI
jgi:predicted nucleotidyltransferase